MKLKIKEILFLSIIIFLSSCTKNTLEINNNSNAIQITSPGMYFSPDTLVANVGDTITFSMTATHNAVEVSKETYLNDGTESNNGFEINYGETKNLVLEQEKVFYYVCQPHVQLNMKGIIIVLE